VHLEIVNPRRWAPEGVEPRRARAARGRLLFVAGMPGWSASLDGEPAGFAEQFARALDQVLTVVREAGGEPDDVARMTVYVTDLTEYRAALPALGEAWRQRFGRHYPAMALLEVSGLVDRGAKLEIEATAVVAGRKS
jgi:enamine deaminase RidA (YjgF/YER057c/UK114 family)